MATFGNIDNPPPFHENWDDTHCTECCLRGVLDFFEPYNNLSWEDVDKLSNKVEGKWNWPQFGMMSMIKRGYYAKRISSSRPEDIVELGAREYLIRNQGLEAAEISIKNSPPLDEIEHACRELLTYQNTEHICKIPDVDDVKTLLSEGYLISSIVNSRALNNKEGYSGHAVLIYGMDDEYIYFHDSGLPAVESRKEKIDFFVQCAKNPTDENWYIIGYKK